MNQIIYKYFIELYIYIGYYLIYKDIPNLYLLYHHIQFYGQNNL